MQTKDRLRVADGTCRVALGELGAAGRAYIVSLRRTTADRENGLAKLKEVTATQRKKLADYARSVDRSDSYDLQSLYKNARLLLTDCDGVIAFQASGGISTGIGVTPQRLERDLAKVQLASNARGETTILPTPVVVASKRREPSARARPPLQKPFCLADLMSMVKKSSRVRAH